MGTDIPEVGVLAHPAVTAVADDICAVLVTRGVRAAVLTSPAGAGDASVIVVVLSRALCEDPDMLTTLAAVRDRRLVPVRAEDVTGLAVPAFLAELNWVLWDTEPAVRNAALVTAVHSDVGRYREAKSLEAVAAAWEASGYDPDYLMSDRAAVREALARLDERGAGPSHIGSAPSPRVRRFLQQSDAATRSLWWKRNRRWAFRAAALIGVIAIAITGWHTVTAQRAANRLAIIMLHSEPGERGDLVALKIAGLIDQQAAARRPVPYSAVGRLMEAMSANWDDGVLGVGAAAANNAFAWVGAGHMLVADGHGAVSLVSPADGAFTWRRRLSSKPLTGLAANADGSRLVAVDTDDVAYVVEVPNWHVTATHLPAAAQHVAMSATGSDTVAADLRGGRVVVVERGAIRDVGTFDRVLDLVASPDGRIRALVRGGSSLRIVDAVTGAVDTDTTWEPGRFEVGAIARTGDGIVATGPGGQLWIARDGRGFEPTGFAVPDVVRTLALTPAGVILAAADAFGGQLMDPRTRSRTRVCATADTIETLYLSADSSRILCAAAGMGVVQTVSVMVANRDAPTRQSTNAGPTARSGGPISQVSIVDDRVVVHTNRGTRNIDADAVTGGSVKFGAGGQTDVSWIPGRMLGAGEPAVVAIAPDGGSLAVGMTSGTVNVVDLNDDGLLALSSRWVAPDGQPAAELGWMSGGERLVVSTAADRWWTTTACLGCGRDTAKLLAAVKDRLWMCYPEDAVAMLTAATRRQLGVRDCPAQPAVTP